MKGGLPHTTAHNAESITLAAGRHTVTGMEAKPQRKVKRMKGVSRYIPHLLLGTIALVAVCMLGLATEGMTDFAQNTLGSIAIGAVGALAGIVNRGGGSDDT